MKAYGEQQVLFYNKLACVQPKQEEILERKLLKNVYYVTTHTKHEQNTIPM
jgi:hypothetical protein